MSKEKKRIEVEDELQQEVTKDWGAISNREVELDEAKFSEKTETQETEHDEKEESTASGALEHPSYKELENKLTKAEQLAEEHHRRLMRIQAEFENYKKRAERDIANAHKFGVEKLVLDVIPVLDGLDQGLEIKDFKAVKEGVLHKVREGMELTYKMLLDVLKKYGVAQISPQGKAFDPELHEAMSTEVDADLEPNTVTKVFQKGYTLHGRLIRPARVIVSKP